MKSKNNRQAMPRASWQATCARFFGKTWVQIVLLIILSCVYWANYAANFDYKLDPSGDDIYYFTLGKALAEGKGYTNIIGFDEMPHTHFPPGYPLYISVWQRLSPNNFLLVKKADGVLLWLSVLLLFFLLKKLTGGRVIVPFLTCLLASTQVDLLRFACMIMSEPLYLFCTLAILYLGIWLSGRDVWPPTARWYHYVLLVVFLFFVGYVCFVRSIGMSVTLALLLWLAVLLVQACIKYVAAKNDAGQRHALKPRIRHLAVLLVLSTAAFAVPQQCWNARNARLGVEGSSYKGQFMKKENGATMTGLHDWTQRIGNNTQRHITGYIPQTVLHKKADFSQKPTAGKWLIGIGVLLVMLAGLLQLKRGGLLLFFYMGATMAVLILYAEQYSNERYFWAIIPFFFFLFLNGIAQIVEWLFRYAFKKPESTVWQNVAAAAIALLFMLPQNIKAQTYNRQLASLKSWKQSGITPLVNFMAAAEWCGANLPDTAHVACRKPETFYVNSHFHKAVSFPHYAPTDSIISYFTRQKIEFVIIDTWFKHAYQTVYPAIMDNPEKFSLVRQFGAANPERGIFPTLLFAFNPQAGYTGEYKDGQRHGQGKMVTADGRTYIGHFENNEPNGYGELFDAHGNCLAKGIWQDGRLITPQDNP